MLYLNFIDKRKVREQSGQKTEHPKFIINMYDDIQRTRNSTPTVDSLIRDASLDIIEQKFNALDSKILEEELNKRLTEINRGGKRKSNKRRKYVQRKSNKNKRLNKNKRSNKKRKSNRRKSNKLFI